MSNIKKFSPGDNVWIILRDDSEEPVEVAGYVFLADVEGVVLAAPGINGKRSLNSVLGYLMACTQEDDELSIVAVPVEDCYLTREEAKEAMQSECED